MKRSLALGLAGFFLLSACGGASTSGIDGGGHDGAGGDGGPGDSGADQGASESGGGGGEGGGADSRGGDAPVADAGTDAPVADSGGGSCKAGVCAGGLSCCDGVCVNEANDPLHCGGCATRCSGASSMCLGNHCQAPTCSPACASGQQCCEIPGPGPSGPPMCVDGLTCPVGCPLCK